MHTLGIVLLAATAMFVTGCSGNSPIAPWTPPGPADPIPVPPGPPLATLEVSAFTLTPDLVNSGEWFWYLPALRLTETGGRSAARLVSMKFTLPGGKTFSFGGPGCFTRGDTVGAGQTWELSAVYTYCLDIYAPESLTGRDVDVTVSFTDSEGRPGTVTGKTRIQ